MTPGAGERARVLLVEPDRLQARAIAAMLRRRGFGVGVAADGEEALAALARGERPDLVVLDLLIPKVSGFEVLRRLKADAATADIPVIVVSRLVQDPDRQQALADGAAAYLDKTTLSLRDLARHVEAALGMAAL